MLFLNFPEFRHDDLAKFHVAGENLLQFGNLFTKFLKLFLDFLPLQTGQALQLHFKNGFGLNLSEFECGDQAFARFRSRLSGTYQLDDFLDMIQGFLETFKDVGARFSLA